MKYRDMEDIIELIKDIISPEVDGKVFQHHVADAIGIGYSDLRMMKCQNKIPFEEMVTFCFTKNINVYEFLVGKVAKK